MKKLALLLAIIMTLSPLTFAITPVDVESVSENDVAEVAQETMEQAEDKESAQLAATTTPGLYYYQDFENIAPNYYDAATVATWLSCIDSVDPDLTVSLASIAGTATGSYQIIEEDGNRFLRIRGTGAVTFGGHFSDNQYRFSNMSVNYKYPDSTKTQSLVRFDECTSGSNAYYSSWSFINSGKTPSTWTHLAVASAAKGEAIGIGFHYNAGIIEIDIDDVKVWCDNYADASSANGGLNQYQQVAVGFSAGSKVDATGVTMPAIEKPGTTWTGNRTIYVPASTTQDQHNYSKVNLSSYAPTGAPKGYRFAGWSYTDGGEKIKENEYNEFRIPGATTFYAIWEPRETVTITFANSTTNAPSNATLPEALTVCKWESDADNVDLSGKTASTTESFEFLGWSLADNGEVISDLTAFVPDSAKTLYAVWKSTVTVPGLYFYQDFESLPVSTSNYYDAAAVSKWLSNVESPMDGVSVSLNSISGMGGFAARVLEDEDTGNKFLRIQTTDSQYLSFGAHFSDDKLRGFNMAFNYRYTDSWQSDFVKSHDTGDAYYSGWGVENVGTPTTWTYKAWRTDTLSNGLGLAVNNKTIYLDIDDIRVWCVKSADEYIPASSSVNMDLTAKITFDPGSLATGADVTMPTFKHSWSDNEAIVNIPGRTDVATNYHRHDYVNLEACIPTGAPLGYEFAGWSATDGGSKIKDSEYSNYKITGNQTLYALWSEIVLPEEIITYTPNEGNKVGVADGTFTVAAVNEAQGYTSAKLLYANDTEILADYTQIAELNLSSGVAAYTFEGGKAFPKEATKIRVTLTADDKEDLVVDYTINNNFEDETPLFTFYAVSDLHYGEDYWATSTANRNAMVADIQSSNADFVVINGDLVNKGLTAQYTALNSFLGTQFNEKGIPAFITNGNHEFFDAKDSNSTTYDRSALLNTFSTQLTALENMGYDINRTEDNLWYSTEINGAKFIFMSTPTAPNESELASMTVTQDQLDFLDAELAGGEKAGLPMFVFTHVQLDGYVPNATGGVTNTAAVTAILNKYKGVTVLSGHTHSNLSYDLPFVKVPEGTDIFTHVNDGCAIWLQAYNNEGTGSGGETRQTDFSAGYIVEVYGDKVIFKARRFAPDANGGNAYFGHGQYVWYFDGVQRAEGTYITSFANPTTGTFPATAVIPQPVVTSSDDTFASPVATTSIAGYEFLGWSDTDGGGVVESYTPTADATLYAVWGIKETVEITFGNSTTNAPEDATVTLPEAWTVNKYESESDAISLDDRKATTTEIFSYKFLGWSASDNGEVISGLYQPTETATLYAVWEKLEFDAVGYFENFEGYEVGQEVSLDEFDTFHINVNGGVTTGFIRQDPETGNKYLEVTGAYPYIEGKTRDPQRGGSEFMQFEYKSSEDKRGFWYYNDSVWNSENYIQSFPAQYSVSSGWVSRFREHKIKDTVEIFRFRTASASATLVTCYDNIYYWHVPESVTEDTKSVKIDFANSTKNAPADFSIASITKSIYVGTDSETIDLNNVIPTTTEAWRYKFEGWSYTDGGTPITIGAGSFKPVKSQTLYAVWTDKFKPQNVEQGVRTKEPTGIRTVSNIATSTMLDGVDVEFGYIITRAFLLGDTKPEDFTLGFDSNKMVQGACYEAGGINNSWSDASSGEDLTFFSAAFTGIQPEYYNDVLVFRAYRTFTYNGITYTTYGDPVSTTVFEIAQAISSTAGNDSSDKKLADKLIADYEAATSNT